PWSSRRRVQSKSSAAREPLGLPDQWKEPPGHPARIAGVVLQDPLFPQSSEELERGVGSQDRQIPPRGIGDQESDEIADFHRVEGMPNPCVETRRSQTTVGGSDTEAAP